MKLSSCQNFYWKKAKVKIREGGGFPRLAEPWFTFSSRDGKSLA